MALAQQPANQVPPDVVMLQNGGMLRGTISELVPDDYVIIVTIGGETKRIAMSEVKYAGAASQAPGAAPSGGEMRADQDKIKPMVTIHGKEARLKLKAPTPVTFHRRTSSSFAVASGPGGTATAVGAGYDDICTAPCEISIPAGTYTLALSEPGGRAVETEEPVVIPPGVSEVQGLYTSRSGLRTAGWLIAIGSVIGGTAIALAGIGAEDCDDYEGCTTISWPMFGGGMGLMVGGTIVGMVMGLTPDKAEIEVTPQSSLPVARTRQPTLSFKGVF